MNTLPYVPGLPNYIPWKAANFIKQIKKADVKRYLDYWNEIKPQDDYDYYLRWVFAFMSIHTTWKNNVRGFLFVKELQPNFTRQQLRGAIQRARVGLINTRTEALWHFHKKFWLNPADWYPRSDETMAQCRDRLAKKTYGIGLTKTSFVLEMTFPAECGVVCLDTHILQLYDFKHTGTPTPRLYHEMERHWIETCAAHKVPSPIVRHIFWDRIQKKENTRYWSYVLEKESNVAA